MLAYHLRETLGEWRYVCISATSHRALTYTSVAAPFHPKGMAPRAPCPKCLKDKGDDTPKDLYGIRGLDDGKYDSAIPIEWRQCPAIKLDSSILGMSAVRVREKAVGTRQRA